MAVWWENDIFLRIFYLFIYRYVCGRVNEILSDTYEVDAEHEDDDTLSN